MLYSSIYIPISSSGGHIHGTIHFVKDSSQKNLVAILVTFLVLFSAFTGFGFYKYTALGKEYAATTADLGNKIAGLETNLANLGFERTSLSDALESEKSKNRDFEEQIEELAGTLGTLNKLSKIDTELLKKYSKVFFLSEHYAPARLTDISDKFLLIENDKEQINSKVSPFLKKLMEEAEDDKVNLQILSGYRSFATQSTIKAQYKVIYGAGTANQFSAEQGYSEHQLGTAIDFTSPTVGASLNGFDKTPEFEWLNKNAYKYGFVLSYPKGNAYYQYEPWHWRFVGQDLARELEDENKYFYDLDQRDIDKYLITIFD